MKLQTTNHQMKDQLVVGFALFSMFFGAGNIIFPPYLGMGAGESWFTGFVCYYLADIGLAVAAIFALLKHGGDISSVTGRIGKVPGTLMVSAMILCIGPFIAIPRTGATTYEMFVVPLLGDVGSLIPTAIFFAIILLLTIRESAVIDILGKFLTPALFIGLLILIICGLVSPVGPISDTSQIENVVVEGINAGYQTMDVLAAMIFGIIIVKNVAEKGYTEARIKYRVARNSSLIAAVGLLVIYCGLTFLGATASTLYTLDINRSELILNITQDLLQYPGVIILGIVVTLACITTAVALVSASADYFAALSKGKLSYKLLTVLICLFSAAIANFGIDQIVLLAQPILNLIYPGALMLIILAFFSSHLSDYAVRGTVLGAMVGSLCEILYGWHVPLSFVPRLPLSEFGFGWLIFAVVFGIAGAVIHRLKKTSSPAR